MTDEKKFEVHAEITARLTQQDVDDIMASALEGGIRASILGSTQATRFLAVGSLPFGSKSRLRMTRLVICSISTSSSLDLSSGSKIATPTAMLWTVQMAPLTAARLMPSVQTRLSSTHCSAIWYSAEGRQNDDGMVDRGRSVARSGHEHPLRRLLGTRRGDGCCMAGKILSGEALKDGKQEYSLCAADDAGSACK